MKKLAELRKARGLSQRELATAIDVRRETVTAWENGRNELPVSKAKKVAKILEVDWVEFYNE